MNYNKDKSGINFNSALETEAMNPETDMNKGFQNAIIANKSKTPPITYAQEPGKAPMLRNCGSSRYKK
jgi:hypothetical protein